MNSEPRYVRLARAFMGLFTPSGIDGFLLGMAVALGGGVIFAYWFWQL